VEVLGPLLIVVVIGLIAALAYAAYQAKQKRREDLFALATRLGLEFAVEDPYALHERPFQLLRMGDGRGCENVMWGTLHDQHVIEFDYWYYEESHDSKGGTSRSYHRFSCALIDGRPLWAQPITIGPETFGSRLAGMVGFHDIEFESEEFNRSWKVKCDDKRFANYLIDGSMMEWLMKASGWRFELNGGEILCYADRLKTVDVPSLVDTAIGFRAQIPRAALDVYKEG
jgi:hypothetical protein